MASSNEAERQSLTQGLHDAVKQCQIRFGGRTELATGKDSRVQCLLIQFERFFQHGIKRNKIREAISSMSQPLRQVTSKVLPNLVETEENFWPFVKDHLSQLEAERYSQLKEINTDAGRARAWLRSSLNEHSLERYLINFLQNEDILRQYYEDWSLMQDVEKATAIVMMSRGLGPIYFAISINNPELNGPFRVTQQFADPSYLRAKHQVNVPIVAGAGVTEPIDTSQKRRRKKVKPAAINDMLYQDENEDISNDTKNYNTSHLQHNQLSQSMPVNSNTRLQMIDINDENTTIINEEVKLSNDPIVERVANLSTSFKSSFSSLSFERQQSYPEQQDNVTSSTTNNTSSDNPISMRNVNFQATDNSDICTHIASDSDKEPAIVVHELWSKGDSTQDVFSHVKSKEQPIQDDKVDCLSPVAACSPGTYDVSHNIIQRSRYSSAMLDEVLGSGEYLSASDGFANNWNSISKLRTPPPTPSTPNLLSRTSSVDPKSKLRFSLDDDAAAYVRVCLLKEMTEKNSSQPASPSPIVESNTPSLSDNISQTERRISFDGGSSLGDDVSTTSSVTESICNDLDLMKPLGTNDQLFSDGYDKEVSKAAMATMAALNASSGAMEISKANHRRNMSDPFTDEYSTVLLEKMENDSNLSIVDLKQAILLTAKRKEESEAQNRVLHSALDEERERSSNLQCELNTCESTSEKAKDLHKEKIAEILRENDVLKNQLKKYVAAVQMLRREHQAHGSSEAGEVLSSLRGYPDSGEMPSPNSRSVERSNSESDSIFEEKLGQMAELHGELLEFNEMLQKQLINRDTALNKIREELINLRGPLPADREQEQESSRRDSFSASRPLINIWVPSVFMKGKGSDSYHLYQIYLRVGDEEWNIYRRYSQFYKLHAKTVKQYSSLEKFTFPPKKLLGKNDLTFVEKRRKRLQDYLRLLINACLVYNQQLSEQPNKENLAKILPFFCDPYDEENANKKKKQQSSVKINKPNPRYNGL